MNIKIDASIIHSWDSFHKIFKTSLEFPDFYGKNMDAWIDCMDYIDDPQAGMTRIFAKPNEIVILELINSENLKQKHSEIYYTLLDCVAVNRRKIEANSQTFIIVVAM